MSKLVDERVVEMRFDNSNFERNTRQSMSTIQKLKASLNFSGVSNSLNKSVNSVDMSPITVGLEKASKSFSAWEVASITAISNVTNRIVDLGIEMVKSLSVDNITAGWQKFTQQTKNTGTIISQLSSTMDKEAASSITEEYMQKLMWFADATSYSLTDMTSAIGKMIAKGKDINTAFEASVGIANWAAASGKSAQETQGVFEALAKVSDHVLARQWYSIQAANMDTIEFKNAVLETAAAMGTLDKSAERFDGTIEYITKKGHTVTAENFTDYFQDEWFSFDVLLDVLGDYGSSVDKVMKLQKELGLETPYEALDIFTSNAEKAKEEASALGDAEKQASAEADLFSAKQFKAASEARTLEDAINAVKDAVSTGWLNIFQKIVGTYENATDVFSELADKLVDIFLAPVNAINGVIDGWRDEGGREDLFGMEEGNKGAIWNLLDAFKNFIGIIKQAFKEVFPFNKSLKDITQSFQDFTKKLILSEEVGNNVKNIFKGIFSIFNLAIKILKGAKLAIDPIIKAITGNAGGIIQFFGDIGEKFSKWVSETEIFNKVGATLGKALSTIIEHLKELKIISRVIDIFKDFFKQLQLAGYLNDLWQTLSNTFGSLFNLLVEGLKNALSFTSKYLVPALAEILKYLAVAVGFVGGALLKGFQWLLDRLKDFFEFLRGNETVQTLWKKFISFMKSIPDRLKKLGPFFQKLGYYIGEFFKTLWNGIKAFGTGLSELVNLKSIGDFFAMIGDKIAYGFNVVVESIKSFGKSGIAEASETAQRELSPLMILFQGLMDLLRGLWNLLKAVIPFIGKVLSTIGNLFTFLGNSINKTFNTNIQGGTGLNLWAIISGGALVLFLKWLYDFFFLFKGITSGIGDIAYALAFNLRAKGVKEWAEAVRDIALSLLIVVGAILLVTMIDPAKLKQAALTILTIMAVLGVIMLAMGKFMKTTYTNTFKLSGWRKKFIGGKVSTSGEGYFGVSSMILSFGLAVLALAAALKIVDSINEDKIVKDMAVLIAIMLALGIAVGAMNSIANIGNKTGRSAKGLKGLVGFALAMLILLYPLKKIGEMPLTSVLKSLGAIYVILIAYGKAVGLMNGFKARGMSKMVTFAAAMAALVAPIKMLSEMDFWALTQAMLAVTAVTMLFGLLNVMSEKTKASQTVGMIALMGAFVGVLYGMVYLINGPIKEMSNDALGKFAIIVIGIIAVISFIGLLLSQIDKMKTPNVAQSGNLLKNITMFMVALASLLVIIYVVVKISQMMETINWESFGKYAAFLGLMIGVTAALFVFAKFINRSVSEFNNTKNNLILIGAIMYTLVTVVGIMAGVAKVLDTVSWDSFKKTIGLMGAVLASVIGLMLYSKFLKADNSFMDNIIGLQTIMIGLTAMMLALAVLVSVADRIDPTTIWKTLGLIAVSLLSTFAVVFLASKFEKNIRKTATSLALLGIAFASFGAGVALFAIGMQTLMANVAGLMIFIGLVLTMAVAVKFLGGVQITLLEIAFAFGLMGVAALAIGGAFYLIVLALEKLLPMIDQLAEKSDSLSTVLSSVIEGIITGIANAIPTITSKLLEGLDLIIKDIWKKLGEFVQWFLDLDLSKVKKVIDKVTTIILMVILQSLELLAASAATITASVISVIIGIIYGIIDKLPELMQALADLIIGFIDALGQTIENNAAKIRDAMLRFCEHLWNAFLNFFGIHSPSKRTEEGGKNIVLGIAKGIVRNVKYVIKELLSLGKFMIKEISKLPKQFFNSGKEILLSLVDGMSQVNYRVLNFIDRTLSKIVDTVYNATSKITKMLTFGLVDMGESNLAARTTEAYKDSEKTILSYVNTLLANNTTANQTAVDFADNLVKALSSTGDYSLIGKHIVSQIAYGLDDYASELSDALRDLIQDSYYKVMDEYDELSESLDLKDAITRLLKFIDDQLLDDEFVIKPVMDTSDIEYGVGYIASLLSSVSGVTVASASVSAEKASNEIAQNKATSSVNQTSTTTGQQITGQNGEVYNVTFNITGPDPKTIADECAKVFYQEVNRRNVKNGHY